MGGENPAYLRDVKRLRCLAASSPGRHLFPNLPTPCRGPVEAHHAGPRGMGQKAPDDTAIPLCTRHHRDWHGATGLFAGWEAARRRAFAAVAIALTRSQHRPQPDWF
jgi:hypothetical protein